MENIELQNLYKKGGISARTCNCLCRAGIFTLDELSKKSKEELMKVRNLGKNSLTEALALIEQYTKEEKAVYGKWIPITDKLPPLGDCIIATVYNHFDCKTELRYPVFYMQNVYKEGYGFYFGDTNNILLPDVSEVTAWMPIPKPFEKDGDGNA